MAEIIMKNLNCDDFSNGRITKSNVSQSLIFFLQNEHILKMYLFRRKCTNAQRIGVFLPKTVFAENYVVVQK